MEQKPAYNLEERTLQFARQVAVLANGLPKSISNIEYARQLVRSSVSVGANYIEANESLSKKDAVLRLRISRKEAKESIYWLRLISDTNDQTGIVQTGNSLLNEATELRNILSTIITKFG